MIDENEISKAFKVLQRAMIEDNPSDPGSYAHAWHCNVAMMCYDAMCSKLYDHPAGFDHELMHKIANDGASRFMKICFDVETKN